MTVRYAVGKKQDYAEYSTDAVRSEIGDSVEKEPGVVFDDTRLEKIRDSRCLQLRRESNVMRCLGK